MEVVQNLIKEIDQTLLDRKQLHVKLYKESPQEEERQMKTLVIVAHPNLAQSVVSKAWCETIQGHATIHDLTANYPDGKIDIAREQALLEAHDRIIFQYPLYWYAAPAILKQWMDAVFTEGWAFGPGGDKMEQKQIAAAVSCGAPEEVFGEGAQQGHSLAYFLGVYDGIASFLRCQYKGFHAVYDTYNPRFKEDILPANCQEYLRFVLQA